MAFYDQAIVSALGPRAERWSNLALEVNNNPTNWVWVCVGVCVYVGGGTFRMFPPGDLCLWHPEVQEGCTSLFTFGQVDTS